MGDESIRKLIENSLNPIMINYLQQSIRGLNPPLFRKRNRYQSAGSVGRLWGTQFLGARLLLDFITGKGVLGLVLVILIATATQTQAQEFDFKWAQVPAQLLGYGTAWNVISDPSGNIYVSGTESTDRVYSAEGTRNMFITKYTSEGVLLWHKTVEKLGEVPGSSVQPEGIILDPSGNLYIRGSFRGSYDFNPGTDVHELSFDPLLGMVKFILKLNANGEFQWVNTYFPPNYSDTQRDPTVIHDFKLDDSGNILVAGWKRTTDANMIEMFSGECVLSKIDGQNGDVLWLKSIVQNQGILGWRTSEWGYKTAFGDMAFDDSGSIYMWGDFEGTIDLDPGESSYNITASATHNEFLVKWDASGNFVWGKLLETTTSVGVVVHLEVDAANNLYRIGQFGGIVDFDPGPGIFELTAKNPYSSSPDDLFITKFDPSGDFLWAKQVGGANGNVYHIQKITTDGFANLYFSGLANGTIDVDPSDDGVVEPPAFFGGIFC